MEPDTLFYDGGCGLCHRAVLFVLKRDRDGSLFRFAPLGGERFERELDAAQRAELPDSLVVLTRDRRLLVRSAAVMHIAARVGGPWRVLAALARVVPGFLRDWLYDLVARVRHRLFRKPKEACPMIPPDLRARFDG